MSAIVQAKSSVLYGRYAIYGEIASGGMASVLYGRLIGPVGFARPVAIKRLHPHIARDPSVVSMFIDEARICARVSHANVVPILDVIEAPGELALVMEYVHGATLESLLDLLHAGRAQMPLNIVGALMLGVLHGLEAAHEARNEQGEPLQIVHRDVSPQNIMLGVDGIPRLFDFGIAKARGRVRSTPSGEVKGKLAYMAPEQLSAGAMDARVDVYAAAVVLWEMLSGRMLFDAEHESTIVHSVMYSQVQGPRALRAELSAELDELVLRGLARDPMQRYQSAREMARTLERAVLPASQSEVSEWLETVAGERLRARAEWLRELQRAAEQGANAGVETARLAKELPAPEKKRTPAGDARQRYSFMRRKPRSWLAIVLFALVVGGALALWRRSQDIEDAAEPARALQAAPHRTAKPDEAREQAVEPAPSGDDWAGDTRVVATPAPSAAEPSATAVPATTATEPAPRKRAPSSAAKGKANCREPYVIDALGVKRWKRECL
jgi:eukaryotic-like serine/threonine-protein kinase